MRCPSCGHVGLLFDDHHGMEHNVCQECGTVVECDTLVVDQFQPGLQDVSCNYQGKPEFYKYGSPTMKAFVESKKIMGHLMDSLNIPMAARELALHFLKYTKSFNRQICVGACVYMAMKRLDIPITMKYISNYLQVSHFKMGKVMKKLEKRIGAPAQCKVFSVDRLAHLIFNQARFGGADGGKKRCELLLCKTEQLLELLLECHTSASHPHIIILAAGYIVWKNLKWQGWREITVETSKLDIASSKRDTLKSYLCEVGVHLSDFGALYEKINVITGILCKFSGEIPWISGKIPSKDMIYFHLDDFIKYKSQLIALAAQERITEQNTKMEDLNESGDEGSSKSCDQTEKSGSSSMLEDCEVSNASDSAKDDLSLAVLGSSTEEDPPKYNFSIKFNDDLGYASVVVKTEPGDSKERSGPLFKKVNYTKVTSLRQVPYYQRKIKKELSDSDVEIKSENNCDQYVEIVSPVTLGKESYRASLSFP